MASTRHTPRATRDPWVWVAFLLPASAVLFSLMQTEDLAYQVRAGELVWRLRDVLRTDPFTFTVAGAPWHNQQWGAQLVLAGLHGVSGWRGLAIVRAAIVGGAVGITYLRTKARGAPPSAAACVTFVPFLVCITLPGTLAMRPQLLAVPLFVLSSVVVAERRRRPRLLWLIPFVSIAWANVHGSFVLLPLLCAVAFVADVVGRRERTWATGVVTVLAVLAPVATPWGLRSYVYVYNLSTAPIVRTVIDEWQPIWRQWPAGVLFALTCVAAIGPIVRGDRRSLRLEDWLTIGLFTALAISAGRNLIWWSLAVPPALGPTFASMPSSAWSRASVRFVRIVLAAVVSIGLVHVLRGAPEHVLADAPPGITTAVRAAVPPDGHVFAGWWFSWLEDAVPDGRMFVDARAELFPTEVWDEYFAISRADPGWDALLRERGVDVVVASRRYQAPLIEAMSLAAGWRQVYADAEGVIFLPTGAA